MAEMLKPCPFCDLTPEVIEVRIVGRRMYSIGCANEDYCPATPRVMSSSEEEVIKGWNTRGGLEVADES